MLRRTTGTAALFLVLAGLAAAGDLRLITAVKEQDRDRVRGLLKQQLDVNATQGDGATALHWAAYRDDLDTAEMLREAADLDQRAHAVALRL